MSSTLGKDAGWCIGSSFICPTDSSISSVEWKACGEVVIESASIALFIWMEQFNQ